MNTRKNKHKMTSICISTLLSALLIFIVTCDGFVMHVDHHRKHQVSIDASIQKTMTALFLSYYDEKFSDSDNFNMTGLNNRIKEVKKKESELSDTFTTGIYQRVQELKSSGIIEKEIETGCVSLPVLCFDALLPGQRMEGSTDDPTFCRFLIETGLGGWFVMTSLDFRSRRIRRNGVLCKVDFIDVAKKLTPTSRIPTSVDFVIVGKKRCRVMGKNEELKLRIGRWKRVYDENGEEVLLGWGEEKFLDFDGDSNERFDTMAPIGTEEEEVTDSTQWSISGVECALDQNETFRDETIQRAECLLPLIDEWFSLASNNKTYENFNVTAATRVRRNQPFLSVEPANLLKRILMDLGERPSPQDPTELAFWAAALINPIPPLGVSLEIRGKLLEACTADERLDVLELGLVRSIQNLKGLRPL